MQVLYLIFNEGYAASSGPALQRVELAAEAIRLTRMLWARLGSESEVGGLLALMLLTHARRTARTGLMPTRRNEPRVPRSSGTFATAPPSSAEHPAVWSTSWRWCINGR